MKNYTTQIIFAVLKIGSKSNFLDQKTFFINPETFNDCFYRELIANKDQINVIPRGQRSSQQCTPSQDKACELLSPEPQRPKSLVLDNLPSSLMGSLVISPATSNSPSSRDSQKRPMLVPDVEEIRVSPIISKKGYLNILEHKTKVSTWFSNKFWTGI